jgi:eukaryotic-like serine/threonine-protein kinase
MATIHRGRDLRMERIVAIKILREVYSTDPKFVTRFQREAKAASSLQHPNIVQVYDYGQSDGSYFIVMEMIEGTDLRRYLRARGILAIDRAIIIAHDVALGLGAAHRSKIVHRDVKPQNVLVGRDGSIKLTDFGIASVYKDINAERLTTTGMTLGTVQYYAPEQAQGEIVSPAADVYALGIVMYEMLTGRTPFDGDTPVAVAMQHIQDLPTPPSQLNPEIPPALEDIILRCLEKIPEMRYRDGNALARALELLNESDLEENIPHLTPPGSTPIMDAPTQAPPAYAGSPRASTSSPNNMMGTSAAEYGGRENGRSHQLEPLVLPAQPYSTYGAAPTYPQQTSEAQPRRPQRNSRAAGIITALILAVTLLLLGFSLYLAAALNFIHIPGISPLGTPTQSVQMLTVPDLRGKNFQQAQTAANNAGFNLQVPNGVTTGIVVKQDPPPDALAQKNSNIRVTFGPATNRTVIVPANLVGNTLSAAEAILNSQNIPFTIQSAGVDPMKQANIVTRVDPKSGTSIPAGTTVILYVVNLTNGTPTVTPSPSPTHGATPTPSPNPSPSPSPSPSPNPSPTPSPSPNPSPTPDPTGTTH